MAAMEIRGFLHVRESFNGRQETFVLPYEGGADTWGVCLGEVSLSHQVPDDFDLRSELVRRKLALLEKAREEAGRKFAETVRMLDEEISKLQAIEYTPATVAEAA